jgi:hypothetical protein
MRKEIFLTVVMLLIVAGCGPKDKDPLINDKDFKTGTDGLKFDFLKSAPPDKVFENENFEVASDIWNKGAYPVREAYTTLTLENAYMCITSGSTCVQTATTSSTESLRQTLEQKREQLSILSADDPEKAALMQEIASLENQIAVAAASRTTVSDDITKDFISGIEPAGMLNGKSVSSPDGMSKLVKYNVRSQQLDPLSVQHTSSVLLTACYAYTTELTADMCIDPDTSGTKVMTKVCEAKDQTFTDQGAPVAVTKIETRILPENEYANPQFVIYVKNLGKGKVVNREKLKQACSASALGYDDWNRVILTEFRLGSDQFAYSYADQSKNTVECKPNPLRLRENDADNVIRCTVSGNAEKLKRTDPAFTSQAYVRLDYGYHQSASKQVIIEKIQK